LRPKVRGKGARISQRTCESILLKRKSPPNKESGGGVQIGTEIKKIRMAFHHFCFQEKSAEQTDVVFFRRYYTGGGGQQHSANAEFHQYVSSKQPKRQLRDGREMAHKQIGGRRQGTKLGHDGIGDTKGSPKGGKSRTTKRRGER